MKRNDFHAGSAPRDPDPGTRIRALLQASARLDNKAWFDGIFRLSETFIIRQGSNAIALPCAPGLTSLPRFAQISFQHPAR